MHRYHDKADVDVAEQPAPAGSGVNMVPLQRPVEVELDLLRLDYCYGWLAIVFDVNGVGVILKSTTNNGGLP
jgi:hypothetical protein